MLVKNRLCQYKVLVQRWQVQIKAKPKIIIMLKSALTWPKLSTNSWAEPAVIPGPALPLPEPAQSMLIK